MELLINNLTSLVNSQGSDYYFIICIPLPHWKALLWVLCTTWSMWKEVWWKVSPWQGKREVQTHTTAFIRK